MFLVCECGCPEGDHASGVCVGLVSVQNPDIPDFETVCGCPQFKLWYDDDESAETTPD